MKILLVEDEKGLIVTLTVWLRQKLDENPRHPQCVQTVLGFGYKLIV